MNKMSIGSDTVYCVKIGWVLVKDYCILFVAERSAGCYNVL